MIDDTQLAVLRKLAHIHSSDELDLTDEEMDVADWLEENGYVRFYDDGAGYPFNIIVSPAGERILQARGRA